MIIGWGRISAGLKLSALFLIHISCSPPFANFLADRCVLLLLSAYKSVIKIGSGNASQRQQCPELQMQRISLIMASKCPKTGHDLVSKSCCACAADEGKTPSSMCPSVHAAACLRVTQRQPELCLLESKVAMKASGVWRNKEPGNAARLTRHESHRGGAVVTH